MGFAQITIIGNLGQDPEMRYTPNGKAVTDMSVAVSHSRPAQNGGWDEETNWFRIQVWGDRAQKAAETYRKGDRVMVHGRFKAREWTSNRTAKSGTSLEVTADTIEFALRPPKEEGQFTGPPSSPEAPPPTVGGQPIDPDDDLPF